MTPAKEKRHEDRLSADCADSRGLEKKGNKGRKKLPAKEDTQKKVLVSLICALRGRERPVQSVGFVACLCTLCIFAAKQFHTEHENSGNRKRAATITAFAVSLRVRYAFFSCPRDRISAVHLDRLTIILPWAIL
jgi:hypothetical protein